MNRKTFLGSILGFGFIANLNAAVKEKVRRIIKDYAGDTLQVRRLEIVDEKGGLSARRSSTGFSPSPQIRNRGREGRGLRIY